MQVDKKHIALSISAIILVIVVVYFASKNKDIKKPGEPGLKGLKRPKELENQYRDLSAIYEEIPENFYECNNGKFSSSGSCSWNDGLKEVEPVKFATSKELFYQGRQVRPNDIYAVWIPVKEILTDPGKFQNRDSDFSEESVERIVNNFDENQLDPITVWRNQDNEIYVLSGHSRLQAHKILDIKVIPSRFFIGNEKQAIDFAKFYANRGQTAEKLSEDIKIFKQLRDEENLPIQELKNRFEKMYNKLELYSFLNPSGDFIRYLSLPKSQQDQFPLLEIKAMWIGGLRKQFSQLSNAHETELFNYLYRSQEGSKLKKEDFLFKVSQTIKRIDFDPEEPLALERKGETGIFARADTNESAKRIRDIDKSLKSYSAILKNDKKADKEAITRTINRLIKEREYLTKGVSEALKNQKALFGLNSVLA